MNTQDDHSSADRDSDARGARTECASAVDAPRLVTRGETPSCHAEQPGASALVDWLAFTVKPPAECGLRWLLEAVGVVFRVPRGNWTGRDRGWFGYTHRIQLGDFGLLGYGGESQNGTMHVELNAQACRRIEDWQAVRVWGEVYGAVITRVDCAHDDFAGQVIDIPRAIEWYRQGAFTASGRPPKAHLEDDLGSGAGRTLGVGRRGSGKYLRVYEKGKKLGDAASPWVRAEVELHNKSRVIPWDVVLRPDEYLAGAYPALRILSAAQCRVVTTRRTAEISYDGMVENTRMQGGKAVNVMWRVLGGDCTAVVSELRREGTPKRLAGYADGELESLLDRRA